MPHDDPTASTSTARDGARTGTRLSDAITHAALAATMGNCDPAADLRGNDEYNTAMAGQMLKRAIRTAAARCA